VRRSCWSSLIKMRLYRLYKDGKERKVKREEGQERGRILYFIVSKETRTGL
jgi:hypothetical protein